MNLDYQIASNPFALTLRLRSGLKAKSKGERSCFDKLSTNGYI